MKLIEEAIQALANEEMKKRFEEPKETITEETGDFGVIKAFDDEQECDIYIEWEAGTEEYFVEGMSYKKEGPFLPIDDVSTNWGEWADEQLRIQDPAGLYVGHQVGEDFALKHKAVFSEGGDFKDAEKAAAARDAAVKASHKYSKIVAREKGIELDDKKNPKRIKDKGTLAKRTNKAKNIGDFDKLTRDVRKKKSRQTYTLDRDTL